MEYLMRGVGENMNGEGQSGHYGIAISMRYYKHVLLYLLFISWNINRFFETRIVGFRP